MQPARRQTGRLGRWQLSSSNDDDEKTYTRCYMQSGRRRISFSAWHGKIVSSRHMHGSRTSDIITRIFVSRISGHCYFAFYIYYEYERIIIDSSIHQPFFFIAASSRSTSKYQFLVVASRRHQQTSSSTSTMTTSA